MHDIVSHNLTVMIALADGARYALDSSPERASGAIERLSATGRLALLEMRRLLACCATTRRPTRSSPSPRSKARRPDRARRRRGHPRDDRSGGATPQQLPPAFSSPSSESPEALTNTLKHARRPASAHLELRCGGGQVELDVTNTGGAGPAEPAERGGHATDVRQPGQRSLDGRSLDGPQSGRPRRARHARARQTPMTARSTSALPRTAAGACTCACTPRRQPVACRLEAIL